MEHSRELTDEELALLNDHIATALQELESIKTYLEDHNWINEGDEDKQQAKFKFQNGVHKARIEWLDKILGYSGIMEYYNKTRSKKKPTVRKGSGHNSTMDEFR